ncbi:MAG: hypothetical protein PHQ35_11565 [Phycisphaerae bacterium]|nr:hypothetical protein [Phycisphaerae bacterium]
MSYPGINQTKKLLAIAGNCFINSSFDATVRQVMNETAHFAFDDITSLKVVFPNWYVDSASTETELGSGGTYTIEASVQYPRGTFTRLLFGGSNQGSIASLSNIESDFLNINIPNGDYFSIRYKLSTPSGWCYTTLLYAGADGCSCEYSATTVTDAVMGGVIPQTLAGRGSGIVAIVGLTSRFSVLVYGDSRAKGVSDVADQALATGNICRALSLNNIAYCNMGVSGDSSSLFIASSSMRVDAAKYYNNIVIEYGINNISSQAEIIKGVTLRLISLLPANKGVFLCTLEPKTTSTDSFVTTANQTVTAQESVRLAYNLWVRTGGIAAVDGYFDLETASSSSYLSGKWAIPSMTADGLHANTAGNLLPILNKAIDITRFKPLSFIKKAYNLVPETCFSLTFNAAASVTMAVTPSKILGLISGSVGGSAYDTKTWTTTIGEIFTVTCPFPNLITDIGWFSRGLSGSITQWNKMTGLKTVDIRSNSLTGVYPQIGDCRALTSFQCGNNAFTAGVIPSLRKLTALVTFTSTSNNRNGAIPDLSSNTALTNFSADSNSFTSYAGASLPVSLTTLRLVSSALPSATINSLLAMLVANGASGGTFTCNGGTNGAPTGQGITDKATLITRSWTVTTN